MRLLLIAIGTRGDVQPFLTLGTALRGAGHDVHIAASEGFATPIAAAGLTHHPLPVDFQVMLQDPQMQGAMKSLRGKLRAYRWASDIMNAQLDAMWRIGLEVAPQLILYHFKGALAPYLGRRLGVPAWPILLQPGFTPTAAHPQFLISARSLGAWGNRASHAVIGAVIRGGTRMMLRRWRRAGGAEIGAPMDPLAGYAPDGQAWRVHGYSAQITPLAADMGPQEVQPGYFFAPRDSAYQPPRALSDFLAAGERPVYIGFGSMPGIDQARVNAAITGALRLTGLRAVVATGWGGIGALQSDETLHVVQSLPHDWLFPQMSAVVHHGGSGTTHEGLRWGRPTVICPLFADQPFFGRRVAALGAGPPPVHQKRLTAERLARALDAALTPQVQARAQALGAGICAEPGVSALVDRIAHL